jgi:hypothetical protein
VDYGNYETVQDLVENMNKVPVPTKSFEDIDTLLIKERDWRSSAI